MKIKVTIEGKTTDEHLVLVLRDLANGIEMNGLGNDESVDGDLVINLEVN